MSNPKDMNRVEPWKERNSTVEATIHQRPLQPLCTSSRDSTIKYLHHSCPKLFQQTPQQVRPPINCLCIVLIIYSCTSIESQKLIKTNGSCDLGETQ